jgi:hypothetical protein
MDSKASPPSGRSGDVDVLALASIALGAIGVGGVTLLAFAVRLLAAGGAR